MLRWTFAASRRENLDNERSRDPPDGRVRREREASRLNTPTRKRSASSDVQTGFHDNFAEKRFGDRIALTRRHFSRSRRGEMSGPMSPAHPGETADHATLRAAAVAMSPRAVWKEIEPDFDRTPQMSFSQEQMAYTVSYTHLTLPTILLV